MWRRSYRHIHSRRGGRDAFCAKLFAVSFCPLQWAAGLFDLKILGGSVFDSARAESGSRGCGALG
jgi:hypothetical protein